MLKVKPTMLGTTQRMNFAKIDEVLEMPNLIEVQKSSYRWFIEEGIREVFRDTGAIEDHTGTLALEFVDYRIDEKTKYSVKECKERDVTYASPLRVTIRLLNKETGEIKEQEKWRNITHSWIGKLNIDKMSGLPNLIYRFSTIQIKVSIS